MRMGLMAGALLLTMATAATSQAQQTASTAVERGKKNFVTYLCYSCHGYAGHGGADTGPRIDTNKLNYEAFARYVRKPGGSMPPYEAQTKLTNAALEDIYAYLKSVPPPPDVKSIPQLAD